VSTPNAPVLSVVIVAYRSAAEIRPCVRSLPRELEGGPVDVVVVNNSPGDGVREIVTGASAAARCIEPETNLGFGRANNRGYAATHPQGEFVLFLNPDTVCSGAALAHCLARLRADAGIGLLSPRLELADGTMDLACRRSIPTAWDGFCRAVGLARRFPQSPRFAGYNLTHLPERGTYDVGAINGAFMLAPRRVLRELAPDGQVFDEQFFMYGDDLDLCIRVRRGGWRVVYDGAVSIRHLKGVSVAKEYGAMSQAIFDANRDVYLKHFNPRGSRLVRWKYLAAFGVWKHLARLRAWRRGRRQVQPL
jgi:GT2 family glycosyltransferase